MKRIAAAGWILLTACQEPAAPPTPVIVPPKPVESPSSVTPAAGKITAMEVTTLFPRQQAGTVLLYDARPGFIAAFGKIPGAISWPKNDFDARLSQREAEIRAAKVAGKPVVVYCTDADCPDALTVAEKLAARGHDVSVLEGGFAMWQGVGLPVE